MQFVFAGKRIPFCAFLVCALVCFTSANAAAFKFRPGAAAPCQTNVNRMDGTATLADIDHYEDANSFEWVVVNESLPTATGLPDDKHIFLDVTSKTNSLPKDASFNTAFTMRLLALNGPDGKAYGLDSPAGATYSDDARKTLAGPSRYPSHVFMTASLKGAVTSARDLDDSPISDLGKSMPRFSQARFRMFFDADGDLSSTDDQTLIAKFGAASAPDSGSSVTSTTSDEGSAALILNWDAALPGAFADQNGNEIATGDVDASDKQLRVVSPATKGSARLRVDFKFECATSGPCTTQKGSILSYRLNVTSARSTISALKPSTTVPAAICNADQSKGGNGRFVLWALGGALFLAVLFIIARRMTRGPVS